MKQSILTITKSAIKFFFDIDPVLTEYMIVQVTSHTVLIHEELKFALSINAPLGNGRIEHLFRSGAAQQLNAA